MNEEAEKDCPLVTKREYEDYVKILNELFFPDPNFKWIEETLSFDKNAFACEVPQSSDMSYSLDQLENDIRKASDADGHLARAVYFFQYKTKYAAVDIQDAYERYIYENNAMDFQHQQHPYGCLMLYSNVAQGIVMVEGQILHVFNHFAGFRYSPIHKMIKNGRILYVREKVSRFYFRKWVSVVVAPPLGVMTYFTTSKKILNRVAEPRMYHFKEKLNRFYKVVSQKKWDETNIDIGENSLFMAPNPLLLFESCCCHSKKEEDRKRELHVPVMDLLPSPALVAYLLKYRNLKSLDRFLDEFLMQPEIESEDETYNIVENTILSNYIESDGEDKPKITKEIKRLCREREIIGKLRKDLRDNMASDTKCQPEWTKEYDIHDFNPRLVKVEVRKEGSVIGIDELADTEEELGKDDERFVDVDFEAGKFEAQRRFVNFVQTGSEAWQKKIKRFGLEGKAVREMLEDARKYKKLQKAMQMLAKQKVTVEEYGEAEETERPEEEEVEAQEEERGSTDSDIGWVSVQDLEKLPEHEKSWEFMGEQMEFPKWGGDEFFGEHYKFDEYYGEYPKFDWSDLGGSIDPGHQNGLIPLSESLPGELTIGIPEEEESIPEAPPASSVTHSSNDP